MDVFITTANAKRMEMGLDPEKAKKLYLEDLYELSLWMLSAPERRWLAAARMFYQNPEFYIQNVYKKVEPQLKNESDWVFVAGSPAYHLDSSCEKLRADYSNFKIPVEIVDRGEDEKQKFRDWFIENQQFLEDSTKFINKMTARFMLRNPPRIEEFQKENSGIVIEENPSLVDIQDRINTNLKKMKELRDQYPSLITEYGMQTHLIRNGNVQIDDPAYKKILDSWHEAKDILKKDLKTYFKVKFNPDLAFQDDLLQSVGFRPCKSCSKSDEKSGDKIWDTHLSEQGVA
ncbi:hypothetical protein [Aeromonas veronii]|uniref:hypothetical protein n=1 Tax=Aeromonas veronii TaxID=654 RepID=UPI0011173878|nr:hypothetical protein [Aeromonas veronii]